MNIKTNFIDEQKPIVISFPLAASFMLLYNTYLNSSETLKYELWEILAHAINPDPLENRMHITEISDMVYLMDRLKDQLPQLMEEIHSQLKITVIEPEYKH